MQTLEYSRSEQCTLKMCLALCTAFGPFLGSAVLQSPAGHLSRPSFYLKTELLLGSPAVLQAPAGH